MNIIQNIFAAIIGLFILNISFAQQTEVQYLSGKGSDDMVQWDFYCTDGMNAHKWTKIGVPSCWELQGFGKYNYGFDKDSLKGKEQGLYKYNFDVPANWKDKSVNIVFEGVMTDALVKINGQVAGEQHQGAFYAFHYDITKLLHYGKNNLLEVTVAKQSSDKSVNAAERQGDFWIFGGIFRPVWLEAFPPDYLDNISIDAKADGTFNAMAAMHGNADLVKVSILDAKGKKISSSTAAPHSQTITIFDKVASPALWSSESPYLYKALFSLYKNGKVVHSVEKKFGFRTIEVRQRDGIYVNGVKMKFKGVNRHSFRPETGRTTNKNVSIQDVELMKAMNMNAVRMSHYPPDEHFLDVCDSLGLYVIDELTGWHHYYDTKTGTKLLKEMIDHDVNHPSIVLWANGNEGGHNPELDHLFADFDIQKRTVIHPWQLFNGIETQHYREYNYGIGNYDNGREIVMPTEFLHGWFDGGHGAGLEDYWEKMWNDPLHAGGFLWDFADEGVVRKDKNDSIDTDKFHAADGILGPHLEKEASYFAIKEIWCPVHFFRRYITNDFDGSFEMENRYQFTNINQCSFSWKLKRFDTQNNPEETGTATAPDIAPSAKGILKVNLPEDWRNYDVLYVSAKDQYGKELFTWSFPVISPQQELNRIIKPTANKKPVLSVQDSLLNISVNTVRLSFSKNTGLLRKVVNAKGELPFNNGPVVQQAVNNFKNFTYRFDNDTLVIASAFNKKESYNTLQWRIYPSGWVKMEVHYFPEAYFTDFDGVNFSFPEKQIKSVTYMGDGPYRVWKNRLKGTQFGVWKKDYNNTETGEYPWIYPEFKGYYSNFYEGQFYTKDGNSFKVATETEDLFLRLFSAAWKTDEWHNYEPVFPSGNISFMNAIPSIGTKTQRSATTGPMGFQNIYYDYDKDPARALKIVLWFDFSE